MVVIMVDQAAGNDSIGNMWTETYLFNEETTLKEVLDKLGYKYELSKGLNIKQNIKLQVVEENKNQKEEENAQK